MKYTDGTGSDKLLLMMNDQLQKQFANPYGYAPLASFMFLFSQLILISSGQGKDVNCCHEPILRKLDIFASNLFWMGLGGPKIKLGRVQIGVG